MIKRKVFQLLLLIILTLTFGSNITSAKNDYNIDVEVELGYDGFVKISSGNPLNVSIKNNGESFAGEVQIEVEDTYGTKLLFAMPFEIGEYAQKDISMDIPVYIIQKNYNIFIVVNNKKIYEEEINGVKTLSPDQNIMAVITDREDNYKFLTNLTETPYLELDDPYAASYNSSYYGPAVAIKEGVARVSQNTEPVLVFLENFDSIDSFDKINYFNSIYIGHNQNLKITEEQEKLINEWVESGKNLIIETGSEYQKINNLLPDTLKIGEFLTVKSVDISNAYMDMPIADLVDTAVINENKLEDLFLYTIDDEVMAVAKNVGSGSIVTLAVNMSLDPMASWNGKNVFIQNAFLAFMEDADYNYSGYTEYYEDNMSYSYQLQQLPHQKQPPYIFMAIILVAYIIVIGPILYIILKKKDKRGLMWIMIPIGSLVCFLILFFYGFTTRYTKPILNSISFINYEAGKEYFEVDSELGVFSDRKGTLAIEWHEEDGVDVAYNQGDDYYYYNEYYEDNVKTLRGKVTLGDNMKYEIYDGELWSPNYISVVKELPASSDNMVTYSMTNDNLTIKLNEALPMELKQAFLVYMGRYLFIGDMEAGDEKTIRFDFNDKDGVFTSFDRMYIDQFGEFNYNYNLDVEQRETQRIRDLLYDKYEYGYKRYEENIAYDFTNAKLVGINDQIIGYDFIVNEEKPQEYSTNIIELTAPIVYEKGATIEFSGDMVKPLVTYALDNNFINMAGYHYDQYENVLYLYEKGILQLDYSLPESIDVDSMSIKISDIFNSEDYYNTINGFNANAMTGVMYYIYNPMLDSWEEISQSLDINLDTYISNDTNISFRIDLRSIEGENMYEYIMMYPEVNIKGVAK